MVGLPNLKMIPEDWSDHHRPAVRGSYNAEIRFIPPGSIEPGDPVPARIQQRSSSDRGLAESGQDYSSTDYLIQVDVDDAPDIHVGEEGHRILVADCPNNIQIEGHSLYVLHSLGGSEAFNRDLLCRDDVINNQAR